MKRYDDCIYLINNNEQNLSIILSHLFLSIFVSAFSKTLRVPLISPPWNQWNLENNWFGVHQIPTLGDCISHDPMNLTRQARKFPKTGICRRGKQQAYLQTKGPYSAVSCNFDPVWSTPVYGSPNRNLGSDLDSVDSDQIIKEIMEVNW